MICEEKSMIGKTVTVTLDRAMGTYHPEHPDLYYPINYNAAIALWYFSMTVIMVSAQVAENTISSRVIPIILITHIKVK
jgi:hypothetical protein